MTDEWTPYRNVNPESFARAFVEEMRSIDPTMPGSDLISTLSFRLRIFIGAVLEAERNRIAADFRKSLEPGGYR